MSRYLQQADRFQDIDTDIVEAERDHQDWDESYETPSTEPAHESVEATLFQLSHGNISKDATSRIEECRPSKRRRDTEETMMDSQCDRLPTASEVCSIPSKPWSAPERRRSARQKQNALLSRSVERPTKRRRR